MSATIFTNYERDHNDLGRDGDAKEVNETDVFVPNNFDLVNQTEPTEVIPQLLFSGVLI